MVATPPSVAGRRSMASAAAAAARPASRRISIGVVPACDAWPANRKRSRSTPTQPVTAAARVPAASIRGPCSMWSSR